MRSRCDEITKVHSDPGFRRRHDMTALVLERLAHAHAQRAQEGLLRRLRGVEEVDGTRIRVGGKTLRNFASNDYLGLVQHPALREALERGAKKWGVGAGGAHLLGG